MNFVQSSYSNMNFERGKSPKDALNIGERALALEIIGVAEITYEREWNHRGESVRVHKHYSSSGISPSHCHRILLGISFGQINPLEYAVVYWPKMSTDPDPDRTQVEQYEDVENMLGKYVKYGGHLYKIPTYDQIREIQESKRSNGSGHIIMPTGCH